MSDSNKVALITGISGQDGSYLTELLLQKVTRCMASCDAPAICCGHASSIFGAMEKFMDVARSFIMAIFPTALR